MKVRVLRNNKGIEVTLKSDAVILVDRADFDLILDNSLGLVSKGYLLTTPLGSVRPKQQYLHRLIAERIFGSIPKDRQVDHINRVKTDNRRHNLRLVTPAENTRNAIRKTRKSNTKFHGVWFRKNTGTWVAEVSWKGKKHIKFGFKSDLEAAIFYNKMIISFGPECLNPLNDIGRYGEKYAA